ncbi:glutamate synthase-related protein [Methanobacterium petrolearium]|uniref:glutamate synthase-related protein n=1 Tax=Methanobacterium petrolearium TaxID=710190 RepID=UPI001AE97C47|nr:glutamate synthase-related protein [Methanobacterium petrolearium]MBP1946723.1 glutamate synthase domain-containing protein 2 [Methanobacterium petrolearium]BDZ70971.1 FMN-binding glutamate synthase family protein [Methanobacterium petrolearium]
MNSDSQHLTGIKNTPENRAKCHCSFCPSYPHDCPDELLYCSTGASECEVPVNGCICNTCPLYYEYQLEDIYYCNIDEVGESKTFLRKKHKEEDPDFYEKLVEIKDKSEGKKLTASMGSEKSIPYTLDDLNFLPAQIKQIPLNQEDPVDKSITIGPDTKKPLKVSSPILISGMSFGAVSRNVRLVISQTAAKLNIGFNSGEGGVLPEERKISPERMIVQYSTGRFGLDEELLKSAGAVEIRFGQGAYPGKGSYLPAEKITAEVAEIRGLNKGESANSPAHHPDITNPSELKEKIDWLRKLTNGIPIGAKIGCGNVEDDINILANAGVDFVALDGFGAGTGATDRYVRDNMGIPILAALPRAHEKLKSRGLREKISLIAGGGLTNSADFAKCLALGADAIYIGTAALIAMNCQQYRVCYTGLCPTGVATQNPQLTKQLNVENGIKRLSNFLNISTEEIANFTRMVGKNDVKLLSKEDLISLKRETAMITGVKWLDGQYHAY